MRFDFHLTLLFHCDRTIEPYMGLTSKVGTLPCASAYELDGSCSDIMQVCPTDHNTHPPALYAGLQCIPLLGNKSRNRCIQLKKKEGSSSQKQS